MMHKSVSATELSPCFALDRVLLILTMLSPCSCCGASWRCVSVFDPCLWRGGGFLGWPKHQEIFGLGGKCFHVDSDLSQHSSVPKSTPGLQIEQGLVYHQYLGYLGT